MQSCCKGVDRGSEVVLAVFPSAQFPGRQVWKMKRVCLPRRPRGQTGEKMTTRHQCQSSLSVLTLQIPQVIGKYLLLIITNTLSNRQVVGKGKFISQITLYRGYYTVAPRYEFYFRVAKQYFTNERSEWVKYCFCHAKIKFRSSSRRVMFFLLYRQKDVDKIID